MSQRNKFTMSENEFLVSLNVFTAEMNYRENLWFISTAFTVNLSVYQQLQPLRTRPAYRCQTEQNFCSVGNTVNVLIYGERRKFQFKFINYKPCFTNAILCGKQYTHLQKCEELLEGIFLSVSIFVWFLVYLGK